MARSRDDLAKKLGAEGLRVIADNLDTIFRALEDGRISVWEGFSMGGTVAGSFARLAPLVDEAMDASWDQSDIVPLLHAVADEIEQ